MVADVLVVDGCTTGTVLAEHTKNLNDVDHVVLDIFELPKALLGTFEVNDVNGIEPNEGLNEANVGESKTLAISNKETLVGQKRIDLFKAREKNVDGFVISFLRASETAFVDAVVDRFVRPFVHFVDLALDIVRIEIESSRNGFALSDEEFVEFLVQHLDDFRRFIIDDLLRLLVEENRNGEPSWGFAIFGASFFVDFADAVGSDDGISEEDGNGAGLVAVSFVVIVEALEDPAGVVVDFRLRRMEDGMDDDDVDELVKILGVEKSQNATGPGAGVGDVDEVTAFCRSELSAGLNPVAVCGGLANEGTVLGDVGKDRNVGF